MAGIVVASGYSKIKSENRLCNQQFALCTSALCVPQPGDTTKAICFCDVKEGFSMSTVPCNQLTPGMDENGIRTIYSTFSLDQAKQGLQSNAMSRWHSLDLVLEQAMHCRSFQSEEGDLCM